MSAVEALLNGTRCGLTRRPLHVGLVYWDPFTPGGVQSQIVGRIQSLGYPEGPVRYTLFTKRTPPDPSPWPHVRILAFRGWERFSVALTEFTAARDLIRRIDAVHREDPFDLVDLHAAGAGHAMRSWSQRRKVPYVFVVHSLKFFSVRNHGHRWEVARAYAWSNRHAALGASQVIAVSGAIKEELRAFGIPTECVKVQHTAVSDDPLDGMDERPKDGPLRVLFVGRPTRDKGLDVLLDAIELCHRRYPGSVELTILGEIDRSARQALNQVTAPVRPLGSVPNAEARSWMRRSHVLVVPSRYDPCPVAVIEGMRAGCVVVGSNVGGVPELLDHDRTGVLVPSERADLLALCLHDLASAPAKRGLLGQAARLAGASFSWTSRREQLLATYHDVVLNAKRR